MNHTNENNKSRREFLRSSSIALSGLLLFTLLPACEKSRLRCLFRTSRLRNTDRLALQWDVDAFQFQNEGKWSNDGFYFELTIPAGLKAIQLRFVLNGSMVQRNAPVKIDLAIKDGVTIHHKQVQLTFVDQIPSENGIISRSLLTNTSAISEFDVVVIGAGMGGGTLAATLASLGKKTCLVEAGPYLFPSHIGNLPRRHLPGQFDKNIWSLWHHFRRINYRNTAGFDYFGSQNFNLGGRSLFWGAMVPRMSSELQHWHPLVKSFLQESGYAQAEKLVKKSALTSPYQNRIAKLLKQKMAAFTIKPAPMAIEYKPQKGQNIPVGVFSTADLVMETKLTLEANAHSNFHLNLNHYVSQIKWQGNRIENVEALDLNADAFKTLRAKHFVLAAGAIESAKLVMAADLKDSSGKMGKGLTSHPIYYTHFAIPKTSPYFRKREAAKLLMEEKRQNNPNVKIILEMGADYNQGRFVNPLLEQEQFESNKDLMLGEVVVMISSDLIHGNFLEKTNRYFEEVPVHYQNPALNPEFLDKQQKTVNEIIAALGGIPFHSTDFTLKRAPSGGVSHEVGTLRMDSPLGSGVVDENLKFKAYDNLFACDLSVFPMSPAANPSLTLVALAQRLANHLNVELLKNEIV
jgi:choline dehydrogenase-like flavoprotein